MLIAMDSRARRQSTQAHRTKGHGIRHTAARQHQKR